MQYAKLFLNRVINENDTAALRRHNITVDDMPTRIDADTLRFIEGYAEENNGEAPSYAAVASSVEGFEYLPEVSDSFTYLAKQVKDYTAKKMVNDWFRSGEFERSINEMGGQEFVNNWLPKKIESIIMRTNVHEKIGTDIKTDAEMFLREYDRRKAGESFKVWKSKFDAIGEYISGNLYTIYGKSGRGKSVIALEDAIHAAKQGANVLIWALEMGIYEVLVRAYTSISGDIKVDNTLVQGVNMDVGFDSRSMRFGDFDEKYEQAFRDFVLNIGDYVEGNIVIRAVDEDGFDRRTLKDLRADIERTNADYVVIDPFYYMDYEANTSRKTGGDAEETSKKLRRLAGSTSATIVAITQADETKEEVSDEGSRELAMPERADVKKTKQLLEDAYQLIGVDTDYKQGRGIVGVNKGRDGGEGDLTEFIYAPQYGVIEPIATGEEALAGFEF